MLETDGHSAGASDEFTPHSIHSSSNSLRSTTPDPQTQRPPSSLLVHTPTKPKPLSLFDRDRVQSELDALRAQHPLDGGNESNTLWNQDLNRLSMDTLRLYVEQLTADVMNLSDQLVELLATRDELVMLREASDDFVILLNLVHQRRARASRAALLMTARTRMRPRGLFRISLPWLNRGAGLTPASSTSSVIEPVDGFRSALHYQPPPSMKGASGTLPHRYTDAIALNASAGSAAYYKALNLQSKQRRPRAQVLVGPGNIQTAPNTVTWRPINGGTHPTDLTCPNGNVVKIGQPWEQVSLSSPQAQQRLDALRKQCASLPWPKDQPQASQMCLVYVSCQLTTWRGSCETTDVPPHL
ncbi:unnamed protein product [Echinostoma caproni]|uniref:t-SNARE coiled-coil homology domain-containing protein n=1 Tax=Echinostoma caproni TaxID=27848 RepID=A0A183AN39_9TREM|nr:unnamed protein product [Echinostoma caproni]